MTLTYVEWEHIPHSHVTRPLAENCMAWKNAKSTHEITRIALHRSIRDMGGLREPSKCRVFVAPDIVERQENGEPRFWLIEEFKVSPQERSN